VGASLLDCSQASAADLDGFFNGGTPDDIPEQKVTFGTGWYIRGDLGVNRLPSLQTTTPRLPTADDQIPPAAPSLVAANGSDIGYTASLGAGYQINQWFRTDVIADFHEPIATTSSSGTGNVFCTTGVSYPNETITATGAINYGSPSYASGACTGTYKGDLHTYDVLFNGYLDLGTWHSVTPYIGAGVGLSFGHYQTSSTYAQSNGVAYQVNYTDAQFGTFYQDFDRTASGTFYNFAFALMAGFSVDVFDHTKLDIGYRYLNQGSVPGGTGVLSSQEVRAGLRYMVDN
jgi:opacity protein-like surface antigen